MTRLFRSTLAAALVMALLGADSPKPAAGEDQQKLQGVWTVVDAKRSGEPYDDWKGDQLVFDGGRLMVKSQVRAERATFTLDPSKEPKTIDIQGGNDRDRRVLGIYILEGDHLKLCFARPGDDRPADFTGKENSRQMLVVLKREKP